ncbi:S41 family peptidase [Mycoplasma feriruminatoris]|uniref:S41 family peptidase n=1 Tax=Mycoplasma feriruminatoris TaxID=1179777 RepID=UPI0002A51664|nr:S41 family peptidase [Mycoplasma feriruminatoris]UKS54308.1 peptidase S41 family protein [Mycoplasma feriruminatoris]VZK65486.1 putative CtpA-like serine protease [Mycoplasma feriruminatoris]VZR75628.1 putative CtpA-like serine protease [Mycoplasma feriruminatoris]VZR98142.1 putative CtpA-like serine protease [Mycoplasma feriruminatoris]
MKLVKKLGFLSLSAISILGPLAAINNLTTDNNLLTTKRFLSSYRSNSDSGLKSYDYVNLINNTRINSKINLRHHNGVAYIGVKEFLKSLDGLVSFSKVRVKPYQTANFYKEKEISYKFNNNKVTLNSISKYSNNNKTTNYQLEVDSKNKTITVSDNDFFTDIFTFYRRGEEDLNIDFLDTQILNKNKHLVFDLSKYGIDILNDQNDLYLPLVLINQLFLNQSNVQLYFNGQTVNLFAYSKTLRNVERLKQLKHSYLNNENHIPEGLKDFQYKYLGFLFDHYYGIELDKNASYKDLFKKYEKYIKADNTTHYLTSRYLIEQLDDLHSSYLVTGYYNKDLETINRTVLKTTTPRSNRFKDIARRLSAYYDKELNYKNVYTPDRKTSVISFKNFEADSAAKIDQALRQAKRDGIKNIVLDVSFNSGGYLGTAYEIMGFMTDKPFKSYSYNPLTKEQKVETIKSRYKKYDFNYYVLTSPFSFSAGNIFPQMVKDNNVAKVIGFKTAGGGSAISQAILPTGDIVQLSSNNVLTDKTHHSLEYGVTPDIKLGFDPFKETQKFFDYKYIQDAVNKHLRKLSPYKSTGVIVIPYDPRLESSFDDQPLKRTSTSDDQSETNSLNSLFSNLKEREKKDAYFVLGAIGLTISLAIIFLIIKKLLK